LVIFVIIEVFISENHMKKIKNKTTIGQSHLFMVTSEKRVYDVSEKYFYEYIPTY